MSAKTSPQIILVSVKIPRETVSSLSIYAAMTAKKAAIKSCAPTRIYLIFFFLSKLTMFSIVKLI